MHDLAGDRRAVGVPVTVTLSLSVSVSGEEQRVVGDAAQVRGDDVVDVPQRVLRGSEQLRGAADAVRLLQGPGAGRRGAGEDVTHARPDAGRAGMAVGAQQVLVEEAGVAAEEVGQQAGEVGQRAVCGADGAVGQGEGGGGDGGAVDQGERVAAVEGEGVESGGGQGLGGRQASAVRVGVSAAAQGLRGIGERDQVAAGPHRAVPGDGGCERRGEHGDEPLDDLGGHAGEPLGERPGAQQECGADDVLGQVRSLPGAEVGQCVVALVGLVGPAGIADECAEAGGGAVDAALLAAVVVPQAAEERPAAVDARAGRRVQGDGERPGRAGQDGVIQRSGQ